jgi:hypothetical protein
VNSCCLILLLLKGVKKDNGEDRMEKIEDLRPTTELSPEMIKTIYDAISQEFYSRELSENDDIMTSINLPAEEDSNKSYVD